ncbi:DddA-like double-stranded DNA deaminase toxin [Streptoalloteichus tenebrarius]|uniref:DddA-like double-stranded DNA deaminase toxin n=1 Tax=Streptoalloteichus tenebrarius (strain ATCC 17920 / DSM 40477 / JCM 4838 / CBS 697.72 / NBRC 16177 / NCIMB 11028 / NRRL B-12390 / A12253. 1 / ISP 5477) TaxID=1933 RepID=UPI0020A5C6EB|nr:DddA-like double-stranded DNA deaminase toxin [Streptoalloteichus tenebrarius]
MDSDGIDHPVRSGAEEDGLDKDLARYMVEAGLVPPDMTRPGAATHVELKVAYRMRTSGSQHVELAINNNVDTKKYGCHRLLPYVLAPGQTLVIHDPRGTHVYEGKGRRT